MSRLAGKICVVTGAGTGIGREIAQRFAVEGATVVCADVNGNAAEATTGKILERGGKARALAFDVGDFDAVTTAYATVAESFGALDIQVSNAGVTMRTPFLEVTPEQFHAIIRTNLYGVLFCGQKAAKLMRKGGNGGRIVNITSVSGQQGGTGRAAYGASKAGIINLTQTMAMELAPHAVTVNAVAPGPTQVPRLSHGPKQRAAFLSRMALKRYATPQDIAAAVTFLASPDAAFITGHVLNVDGGFAAAGVLFDPADEL